MIHRSMKPFAVIRELAIVVAKRLLIQVAEQMERFNADIRATDPALEQAPKVFESVGMDTTVNISLRMVNHLVRVVASQTPIGEQRIGVERGFGCDVVPNMLLQDLFAHGWYRGGSDFSPAFKDANNRCLISRHVARDAAL